EPAREVAAGGGLRRPHPQGREARRPADPASGQIHARDQSQDRQSARTARAAPADRPRRRGDRMRACVAALLPTIIGGPATPTLHDPPGQFKEILPLICPARKLTELLPPSGPPLLCL